MRQWIVFGEIVDTYTMTESVMDEITVRIVYEGRAAKVCWKIERFRKSKLTIRWRQKLGQMNIRSMKVSGRSHRCEPYSEILDVFRPSQLISSDTIETRIEEGSTIKGKAMFVVFDSGDCLSVVPRSPSH